jgi:hypothetical protein
VKANVVDGGELRTHECRGDAHVGAIRGLQPGRLGGILSAPPPSRGRGEGLFAE